LKNVACSFTGMSRNRRIIILHVKSKNHFRKGTTFALTTKLLEVLLFLVLINVEAPVMN